MLDIVVHVFNSSTWAAETSYCEFEAFLDYTVRSYLKVKRTLFVHGLLYGKVFFFVFVLFACQIPGCL